MIASLQKSLKAACVCAGLLACVSAVHAADVTQIANSGNGWNDAQYWGSAAASGNNYFSTSFLGTGSIVNEVLVNGTQWSFTNGGTAIGTVRDNVDPGSNSTFGGDSLTLVPNTRILGKVRNGSTSTVNLVFGGGFYMSGANSAGSAILAGTMSFADGINLGAIAVNRAQTTALTINSTLIGDSSDTLQLSLFSENGNIVGGSSIVFAGDLSNFAGTLYVGTSPTNNGSNPSSFYSVQSGSTLATLSIDTASFVLGGNKYHLDNDVTFGSLIVGGTTLGAGTYDFDDLNGIAGGSFFTGAGTITVAAVPEPSACAAGVAGLLAGLIAVRRRQRIPA